MVPVASLSERNWSMLEEVMANWTEKPVKQTAFASFSSLSEEQRAQLIPTLGLQGLEAFKMEL